MTEAVLPVAANVEIDEQTATPPCIHCDSTNLPLLNGCDICLDCALDQMKSIIRRQRGAQLSAVSIIVDSLIENNFVVQVEEATRFVVVVHNIPVNVVRVIAYDLIGLIQMLRVENDATTATRKDYPVRPGPTPNYKN
jgi:hypothetical protein